MLVDYFVSKKSSKNNNKNKKPMKAKGGVTKKKVTEVTPKGICCKTRKNYKFLKMAK